VAFTEYFAYREERESTPGAIAAYCARMVDEHRSPVFEGKLGVRPVAEELELARRVRDAIGPDRELRFDVNMGWSHATAREALPVLDGLGVTNVEEPVSSFADMAKLREVCGIRFSAHAPDLDGAVEHGTPDAIVLGVAACGGVSGTLAFAERCRTAGVGFWFYSGDLGIQTAAYLHIAAVTPWIAQPSQSLRRWTADDVVAEGPFAPERGVLPVPQEPGLGVHLDEAALRRCVERYAREGEYRLYADDPLPRY
jgi:glucarate dehydratase